MGRPASATGPGRATHLTRAIVRLALWILSAARALAQAAFYQAAPSELAGAPGTLIRQDPMVLPEPFDASGYRVLHRSTGLPDDKVRPGVGHGFIARDAAGSAVAWMADSFPGTPPPSDCKGG